MIKYDEDLIANVITTIIDNFTTLANNVNGLTVCKKLIVSNQSMETRRRVQQQIIDNAIVLIQNPFGNYALQSAFENWSMDYVQPIIEQFYNRFYYLSMHKYSSNVVEKCIQMNGGFVLTKFIEEICEHSRVIGINCK